MLIVIPVSASLITIRSGLMGNVVEVQSQKPERGGKQKKAELRIRQEIFEGRFGKMGVGTERFADFVDRVYLPWAKANKRSWKDDQYKLPVLKTFFHNTSLRDAFTIAALMGHSNVRTTQRYVRATERISAKLFKQRC